MLPSLRCRSRLLAVLVSCVAVGGCANLAANRDAPPVDHPPTIDRAVPEGHHLLPIGEAAAAHGGTEQHQRPWLAVSGEPGPCLQRLPGLLLPPFPEVHADNARRAPQP